MTKSNREMAVSMGGNVLDEVPIPIGTISAYGETYAISAPPEATSAQVARSIAATIPGATANGSTVTLPHAPLVGSSQDAPLVRLSGTADDLRNLSACLRKASDGGKAAVKIGGVTYRVRRMDRYLGLRSALDAFHIVGTAADLTSLACALDHAADNGSAAFLPVNGCGVSIAREERETPRQAEERPDPAPGQVWAPPAGSQPHGWLDADGTLTIDKVDPAEIRFRPQAGCSPTFIGARALTAVNGWRCIGVETPHGRVMVGDEFATGNGWAFTIAGIVNGDHLVRRYPDGSEDRYTRACYLLDWHSEARRTSYAPARKGERYRHRTLTMGVATIEDLSDTYGTGLSAAVRKPGGARAITMPVSPDGRMRADQWERLDPATESDESLRARCVKKLGVPALFRDGTIPDPMGGSLATAIGLVNELRNSLRSRSATFGAFPPSRHLATPGGIPSAASEPTAEERVTAAILDRRCLDLGTPRREGERDADLTARLDAEEVRRLLDKAIAKGAPWLAGIAYAREGHTVTLPDARAFLAALDVLTFTGKVDAAVETFRRKRMATGPTWLRGALERAARELPGYVTEQREPAKAEPRVRTEGWTDWQGATHFWERGTR